MFFVFVLKRAVSLSRLSGLIVRFRVVPRRPRTVVGDIDMTFRQHELKSSSESTELCIVMLLADKFEPLVKP